MPPLIQSTTTRRPTWAFVLATGGVLMTSVVVGGLALGLAQVPGRPKAAQSAVGAHDPQAPLPETMQTLGVMYPNGGNAR